MIYSKGIGISLEFQYHTFIFIYISYNIWLVVWNIVYLHSVGNVIIPTSPNWLSLIFFRGVGIPPTRYSYNIHIYTDVCNNWMIGCPLGKKNGGWDGICVNDRSDYHGRFSFVAMSPYPVHDGTKGVIAGLWIFPLVFHMVIIMVIICYYMIYIWWWYGY